MATRGSHLPAHSATFVAPRPTPSAARVHARSKPLDRSNDDALLRTIADLALGYSGAELANLLNEGAILAVRAELASLQAQLS